MAQFSEAARKKLDAVRSRYPTAQAACLPALHIAQGDLGALTPEVQQAVADYLGLPVAHVYGVTTFYTMFQLQPVGRKAHVQVCGTTPCMLAGSEHLIEICRRRIAEHPHELSADGDFSWEEVECLGSCANAPMVQIWKDTYEDLTPERLDKILDGLAVGAKPKPGTQEPGRHTVEPLGGPTTLKEMVDANHDYRGAW